MLNGKLNKDGMNLRLQREASDSRNLGYELTLDMREDKVEVSPLITYKINDDISVNSSIALNSNYDVRFTFGLAYNFTPQR